MKVLVVIGHQNPGSFCHGIAETAIEQLRADGHEVIFHDLYEEKFDPILPHDEIPPGTAIDPVVRQHADELQACDGYIIIHPNWWGQPPAILKGWVDRVIRQGECYRFTEKGVEGFLWDKSVLVITTSNTPRDVELQVFGDPLENLWKTCVFAFCGVERFLRRNFESIVMSSPEDRAGWLEETRELVKKQFPA